MIKIWRKQSVRNPTKSDLIWHVLTRVYKQRAYHITDIENMTSGQYLEFPNIKIENYVVAGQNSLLRGINKSEHFHGCLTTDSPPSIMISVHWGNAFREYFFFFDFFEVKHCIFFTGEAMLNWLFCKTFFIRAEQFWPLIRYSPIVELGKLWDHKVTIRWLLAERTCALWAAYGHFLIL